MTKISTYDDLLLEKKRLKLQLQAQKMELRSEIVIIKEKLRPVSTVVEFADKLLTKDKHNPLIDTGLSVGIDLILRKLVLRNAGWVIKLIMPLFVRNYLSHEIKDDAGWMQKITRFLQKKFA